MLLNVAVAILISGRYATYVGVDAGEGLGLLIPSKVPELGVCVCARVRVFVLDEL
jgi:hypothetical protein